MARPTKPFTRAHINLGYAPDHPDGVNTLPELIDFNARHNPDHVFGLQTRAGDGVPPCQITFKQLQEAVERASAWLVKSGATTGRTRPEEKVPPVGILLGSDITIYIYIAALLRIGTPVLCLSARLTPVAIAHLLKATSPSTLLINGQVHRAAKETASLLNSDAQSTSTPIPAFLDAIGYEDLLDPVSPSHAGAPVPPVFAAYDRTATDAIIMHSSGTTGLPKPIYHATGYVLIYAACHRLPEQTEPWEFNVSTLPLYHGFGLLAPSLALSIGMPFVLPPATVIPTARSTLAVLKSTGARSMLSVPSILEDILNLPGTDGLDALRKLDFIAIGGAPMKEPVGEALVKQGVKLLNHWGATEIGAIAPIERIPPGYDWHYLMPRTDIGLKFIPTVDNPSSSTQSYRLVGQAPGWTQPFVVQDLLEAHPVHPNQVRIMGRSDDLIVLATGEKVRPTGIERAVAEHPDVKDVLAFGDGMFSLGLLVEVGAGRRAGDDLTEGSEALERLLAELDEYLAKGNEMTDKHGKVAREMLVVTREEEKALVRTDKGSLARKATFAKFEQEIKHCYERADVSKAEPFPRDEAALKDRDFDTTDFFEAGMDSLQASRLRRAIVNALRVTADLPKPVGELAPDFVFERSSVEKLWSAVCSIMKGTYVDGNAREACARASRSQKDDGAVVLLTGSTGSLGCMLVQRLANDQGVKKVICLNRPQGGLEAMKKRQLKALENRGGSLSPEAWKKVVLRESEISRPDFGLSEDDFAELLDVTHIIHNAWPVNFNRNLDSFEPHVKATVNLVRLCLLSTAKFPSVVPKRLLFASSIAVVGRYPLLHPEGPFEVPETPLEAVNTAEFGYPEAKWVCEQALLAANEFYGAASPDGEDPLLLTSSVRIGQMTGPEGSGAWNESEHFPLIVRTSQTLQALPDLDGSLSWMPVNRAASAVAEFLFSKGFQPIYHMENPSRQSWSGLMSMLSSILSSDPSTPLPKVPFEEWLNRVKARGDDPEFNPAYKIMNFLENDFVRMASGPVILSTARAKQDSQTMVRSTAIDGRHLEEYVAYWKRVAALH
ncbi:acetyl-CoA synthetase-like protein [Gloeophyllum trabeum ATCC 11539]|uniref:Acetyl-CoA synthetase-like protein n=1 Tax=Gloeophyllum trabeum (strain ATCC 11539 / FP-39264 / Madison 617) TaxID=670483 RepID=S7Q313_GLOTA|nr:acetyl-CoA synthetase-like protein [Gloeophyllum trabeum ATCC 11539]EPQ54396.1 acetyl-CoA synthetase-like protein [Gloeophyllum trabeum ATCC 11539]